MFLLYICGGSRRKLRTEVPSISVKSWWKGSFFTVVTVDEYPNACFRFSNDDITVNDTSIGYIKLNSSHFKPNARFEEIEIGLEAFTPPQEK